MRALMHRLYHVPLSPYCRKVRLTLAEKKIEVDLVEQEAFGDHECAADGFR